MTTLFITNRAPKGAAETNPGRVFKFDLDNNAPSNQVYFCERLARNAYREVGSIDFLRRLKVSPFRQLLVYIHGFSNLPEDVFTAVEEFQSLATAAARDEMLVVPLIWPCDNDLGVVKDYWDDQKSADMSAASFARLLEKFMKWRNSEEYNPQSDPCLKRINVLAHSMGNRVLRQTLAAWDRYDLADGVPLIFRSTFLVAADIVNESLERGQPGELICHASRNVVVYFASDDLALRASKAANLKNKVASRRLGHSGPENMETVPGNVYAVDCDDVNNLYDSPKGHSYFRSGRTQGVAGVVFNHIFETLQKGRVPTDQSGSRTLVLRDG